MHDAARRPTFKNSASMSATTSGGQVILAAAAITSPLVAHLEAQGALKAAARLDVFFSPRSAVEARSEPLQQPTALFSLADTPVTLVDNVSALGEFVHAMRCLLQQAGQVALDNLALPPSLALDAEWRPDLGRRRAPHRPSLLQLATPSAVWLIDFEAAPVAGTPELLALIAELLASKPVRILGFGIQQDLDKLQMLFTPARGFPAEFRLEAERVVDLRDVAAAKGASRQEGSGAGGGRGGGGGGSGGGEGLSAQLLRWAGCALEKEAQCSDWATRPLSQEQKRYAAADALCLHALDSALHGLSPGRSEVRLLARIARDDNRGSGLGGTESDGDDDIEAAELHAEGLRRVTAAAEGASARLQSVDHGDVKPAVRVVRVESLSADSTHGEAATGEGHLDLLLQGRQEVNSLCFTAGATGLLLVLAPAGERVDTRWLALALGLPRRKVKLATVTECEDLFGATAGLVPPLPLRSGVCVVCHPHLLQGSGGLESANSQEPAGWGLWASAADHSHRLLIDCPRHALPALVACAEANRDSSEAATGPIAVPETLDGTLDWTGSSSPPTLAFGWLPDPRRWHSSLDEALVDIHAMREGGPIFGESTSAIAPDPPVGHDSEGAGASAAPGPAKSTALRSKDAGMEQMGSAAAFGAHSKGSRTMPAIDPRAGKGAEDDDDDDDEEEEEEGSVVSADDHSEDGNEARLPDVKLIVDPSLSVLARKLRMVGIDTKVAGEVIKHQEEGMMISPNADGEHRRLGGSLRESL